MPPFSEPSSHLHGQTAKGVVAGEPVAQFEIGDYKNFIYLVLDWQAREAAIIDPQTDLSAPLGELEKNGFRLSKILLTHTHWDHIGGVPELLRKFPEIELHVHERDTHRLKLPTENPGRIHPIRDGERIPVGSLELRVLHTPGHSAGECCFFLEQSSPPCLFTGDTLFIRDCGRTDLESGSTSEMFNSLQRIKKLPAETVILPGHHYAPECASTLARELEESPPLQCGSVQELERLP